ncbi:MAG: Basic proline-rich protein precursor [Candidatus Ozemobacter sibiricus]|uniref:Basic proline-rich protein n=1 Tax=Candidatus Ozemobacter sibiricus TaxID=2268124 RepID=A0A367ZRT4_9BACT|nr:MAG: Basic proline-rich protein precursor [Candidatus Ozemobacter sibiricus]
MPFDSDSCTRQPPDQPDQATLGHGEIPGGGGGDVADAAGLAPRQGGPGQRPAHAGRVEAAAVVEGQQRHRRADRQGQAQAARPEHAAAAEARLVGVGRRGGAGVEGEQPPISEVAQNQQVHQRVVEPSPPEPAQMHHRRGIDRQGGEGQLEVGLILVGGKPSDGRAGRSMEGEGGGRDGIEIADHQPRWLAESHQQIAPRVDRDDIVPGQRRQRRRGRDPAQGDQHVRRRGGKGRQVVHHILLGWQGQGESRLAGAMIELPGRRGLGIVTAWVRIESFLPGLATRRLCVSSNSTVSRRWMSFPCDSSGGCWPLPPAASWWCGGQAEPSWPRSSGCCAILAYRRAASTRWRSIRRRKARGSVVGSSPRWKPSSVEPGWWRPWPRCASATPVRGPCSRPAAIRPANVSLATTPTAKMA